MWHQLENVAENHFFDANLFKKFAIENKVKYGLDKYDMVSTWHSDDLIKDYKAFRGKEYEQERTNEVKRQVDIERRINAIKK